MTRCDANPSRSAGPPIRTAVVAVVAACGLIWSPPTPANAGGMPTLQIQHARGITVIEPDRGNRVVLNELRGLASSDGRLVTTSRIASSGGRSRSTISLLNAKTGSVVWSTVVTGRWRPEAMRADGSRIILGDPSISPHHADVPIGRTSTTLMLLDRDKSPRVLTFPGNVVAEAFSTSGTQAVLVEHLPAERPTSYRVRPLDLTTGRLLAQTGAVKTASPNASTTVSAGSNLEPTVMQGVRINQSWAPSGNGLNTLYDASPYGATSAMFVHALDLQNVTATCLAVPGAIDAGAEYGSVLSVDDKTIVVVGRQGIATIDAKTGATLKVALSKRVGRPVLAASGASIWVASGDVLEHLNLATLDPVARYAIPAGPRGIVPLSYGPVTLLDGAGTIWFVGAGISEPIKRGRVSLATTGPALLVFP